MPTCHYHPNVETLVSCGRCGKPLCPDCVGHGATGVRCKECPRQSPEALGLATGRQIARYLTVYPVGALWWSPDGRIIKAADLGGGTNRPHIYELELVGPGG